MTETTTGADLGPPPSVDVQDPLPEASFFWRRLLVWAVLILSSLALAHNLEALHDLGDKDGLLDLSKWIIFSVNLVFVIYMLGANAEELVRLLQSSKLLDRGVTMTRRSTAETSRGKLMAETTAGIPSESQQGGRSELFQASPAPESQISPAAADGAPTGSDDGKPKDPSWQ